MSEAPLYTSVNLEEGKSPGSIGGLDVTRKEAWPFYRTISGVCLCWVLEQLQGPKGLTKLVRTDRLKQLQGLLEIKDTHCPRTLP